MKKLLLLFAFLFSFPLFVSADEHLDAYLKALRDIPQALESLNALTGQTIPQSGPLTPEQEQFMYQQLFDASGQPTLAYSNPTLSAAHIGQTSPHCGYFDLWANTGG